MFDCVDTLSTHQPKADMYDKKTTDIAAYWIALFDAAVEAGNLAEMQRVVDVVNASPNRPLKREFLRQLEA